MPDVVAASTCNNCGATFEATEHQLKSATVVNCPACKFCLACGGFLKAGPRPYRLRLCRKCVTLAWRSCWRKEAHLDRPDDVDLGDGQVLHAYHCELCGRWHRTGMPSDADPGPDYSARRSALAALFDRIGFDIDAFRHRTPADHGRSDESEEPQ